MARGRNRKGQFTKRASVSIVRRRSRGGPLVVRETRIQVPRRRGRGGGGGSSSNRERGGLAVAGAAFGYVEKNHAATLDKIPKLKGSVYLTIALAGHFGLKPRRGSALDYATSAATVLAGREIGAGGILGDEAEWR